MRRLVILGAGFLGSALARGGTQRGWDIDVIGRSDPFNLTRSVTGRDRARFHRGDGVEELVHVLRDDVDAVVIAAGGRFPVPSASEPAADAIGTLSLLIGVCETARSLSPNARIFLFSSAGAVYSPDEKLKLESDSCEPTSPYGMSRRMAEQYLDYYHRSYGLPAHALRCVNIYGRLLPASRGQGVVSAAFRSAITGEPFKLSGDGSQSRDFMHVDDFVEITLELLETRSSIPRILNIGTGSAYSIASVVDAVSIAVGRPIAVTPGTSGNTDTGRLAVDTSLLRTLVDIEPLDLRAGIGRMAREVLNDARLPYDLRSQSNPE